MVLFKLIERSIGLVSTLILARILSPTDFGVIAMALSFIFLAEQLAAFSFDIALIQNQSATREHYDTAWTCNLLLGLSITLIMVVLAYPVSLFYQKPEVVWVVIALGMGPLINGAVNIGIVAFRKDLNFRKEFYFQLSRKALGFLIVVPAALWLQNYWALVIGTMSARVFALAMSYVMHPYRPRFSLAKFRDLFSFSRWLLINNFIGFFKERTSDFFVGRLFGAGSLGVYNVAVEFANLPSTELSAPINRALLPGFAKMKDTEAVTSAYSNALSLMAALAIPCAAGLAALAPYFVPVVLGAKWLEAVPLIQILAFNGALLMFHSPICSILVARGHPRKTMIGNGFFVALLLVLLGTMSLGAERWGVSGAAFATVLTSVISTPFYLYLLRRGLGISPRVFLVAIARPVTAAAVMAGVLVWVMPAYDVAMPTSRAVLNFLAGVGGGAVVYLAALSSLWGLAGRPAGPERMFLDRVRALWARRVAGATPGPG